MITEHQPLGQSLSKIDLSYTLNLPQAAPQCRTLHAELSDLKFAISEDEPETPPNLRILGTESSASNIIVVSDHESKKIAMKSLRSIYMKYIDSRHAALQVNVQYSTRKQLEDLFRSTNDEDLDVMFDRAMALLEEAVLEISKVLERSPFPLISACNDMYCFSS